MIKKFKLILMSIILVLVTSSHLEASTGDCRRGTLDKAYCDEDLDLVADLPQDESNWVPCLDTGFNDSFSHIGNGNY